MPKAPFEIKLAQELQEELGRRAAQPVSDDPLLQFHTGMTRAQVLAQFQQLVERARNRALTPTK